MQFAYGGAQMTDDVAFAYNTQRAKNRANLEAEIERDKMKERTAVTHGFTANGFSRAKMFSDGCQMYHSIASGCIVGAKRWKVEEAEFVSLAIQKMTGRERKKVWTPVFSISDLEKESFVEQLLSRYFNPVDSRAYSKVSIKDIRSRIFECVASVPIEQLPKKAGWSQVNGKLSYFDGEEYPLENRLLGQLRRVRCDTTIELQELLAELLEELDRYDPDNRLAFLIGFGLVTWLSRICSIQWDMRPSIIICGNEAVCRRYADACMKMYERSNGTDCVDATEVSKAEVGEYIELMRDDMMLFACHRLSGKATLAKTIISGRCFGNKRLNIPLAVLSDLPDEKMEFDDFVPIDLFGYEISERFCFLMQCFKSAIMKCVQGSVQDLRSKNVTFMSYEDATVAVWRFLKSAFIDAGVSSCVAEPFFIKLKKGLRKCERCENSGDILTAILHQRFVTLNRKSRIVILGETEWGTVEKPARALLKRGDSIFIPSSYLEGGLLSLLGMELKDFKRFIKALLERGVLRTYENADTLVKKITVSSDRRINAYELRDFLRDI